MSSLPAHDAMLSFIIRFVQLGSKDDEIRVKTAFADDFVMLFGPIHRVRRLGQAYLQLAKRGHTVEGRVLVRAAIEHAFTAQWVFYTVGGLDRFRASTTADQHALAVAVRVPAEQLQETLDAIVPGPRMPKWADISRDLDDGSGFVSQSYRVLSQIAHVTHSAVVDGIAVDDSGEVSLRWNPEENIAEQVLYALTGACALAAWLLAVMTGDGQEQRRLRELCHALHIPWRLDQHLPSHRRRNVGPPPEPVAPGEWRE